MAGIRLAKFDLPAQCNSYQVKLLLFHANYESLMFDLALTLPPEDEIGQFLRDGTIQTPITTVGQAAQSVYTLDVSKHTDSAKLLRDLAQLSSAPEVSPSAIQNALRSLRDYGLDRDAKQLALQLLALRH